MKNEWLAALTVVCSVWFVSPVNAAEAAVAASAGDANAPKVEADNRVELNKESQDIPKLAEGTHKHTSEWHGAGYGDYNKKYAYNKHDKYDKYGKYDKYDKYGKYDKYDKYGKYGKYDTIQKKDGNGYDYGYGYDYDSGYGYGDDYGKYGKYVYGSGYDYDHDKKDYGYGKYDKYVKYDKYDKYDHHGQYKYGKKDKAGKYGSGYPYGYGDDWYGKKGYDKYGDYDKYAHGWYSNDYPSWHLWNNWGHQYPQHYY